MTRLSPRFYASGMGSSRVDFGGFADAFHPVGVQVLDISGPVCEQLIAANRLGLPIFCDSGAFPAFVRRQEMDFEQVFAHYFTLAKAASQPHQLLVVAPDSIGDMEHTRRLQLDWLPRLRELQQTGVEVVVPLQTGWAVDRYVTHLGFLGRHLGSFRTGFACNKKAWAPRDVALVARAAQLQQVHLFGIGPGRVGRYLGALWGVDPQLDVSHDANRLRAMIGQGRPVTEGVATRIQAQVQAARREAARFVLAGRAPGLRRPSLEALADLVAEAWDETEFAFAAYNDPGFFTPAQAVALAEFLGVSSEKERERWGVVAQQENEDDGPGAYGCALGVLLDQRDWSGRMLDSLAGHSIQEGWEARTRVHTPSVRRETISHLARQELRRSAEREVQLAFAM